MGYLTKFYETASNLGFSKDYQLKLAELNFKGINFFDEKYFPDLTSYVKKVAVPVQKSTSNQELIFAGQTSILYGGTTDFVEKGNFPITFWMDEEHKIYNLLRTALEGNKIVTGSEHYMVLDIIDDYNISYTGYKLTGVNIKGFNSILYSSDGTGKPQEFTATFSYEEVVKVEYATALNTDYQFGRGTKEPYKDYYKSKLSKSTETNKEQPLGLLQTITQGAKAITQGANMVATTANSIRRAGRAVRGI